MTERTITLAPRQAQTFAEKVTAHNAAFQEMVSYFAAVCDGHNLSPSTEFVSVDPATGALIVRVPDEPTDG